MYTIIEVENANATRRGYVVDAASLADAKRVATRKELFQRTVLKIEDSGGAVVALKENGRWTVLE